MSDDTTDYAREAIEHARHAQALGDQWARHVAVLIAALAAALALAEIGGESAQNAAMSHQIAASDDWALYQAKDVRASIRGKRRVVATLRRAACFGPDVRPWRRAKRWRTEREQGEPSYVEDVTELQEDEGGSIATGIGGGGDGEKGLYEQAVSVVAREGKASTWLDARDGRSTLANGDIN